MLRAISATIAKFPFYNSLKLKKKKKKGKEAFYCKQRQWVRDKDKDKTASISEQGLQLWASPALFQQRSSPHFGQGGI